MRHKTRILCLFLLTGLMGIMAQEAENTEQDFSDPHAILEKLQSEVLRILIQARVLSANRDVIWNVGIDELTIPGRGVELRLNGGNIVVDVEFTPFRQRNNTIMLVAQGETWIKNDSNDRIRYQTSMKSIPINSGAPVIFYPLGVDPRDGNTVNLELEVTVSQYKLATTSPNEIGDDSGKP